ncbi:TonB-dependent siderophore receptor [Marinomonas sp. A3A]|uniref:TonB-dependent siderophore receptor n=1 Tax=Marinomonas sp. A3A TaxID=2065312 RepID=UPI001BB41A7A|nr:TonB-dependent siderophore receptor [Marinomonas sp. A3A]QUX92991.1 TonB-dependent siderophore receptor [Marinomonas sp. A3A]
MNKKNALPLKLKQNHCAAATLFCCSVLTPIAGYAETESEAGTFRLSPIIVNDQALADDDSESVVAKELWVGGKVATSIQDTPASVSVITEKEIKQRGASTTEEVLQYSPGLVTDYYGTDDRNDYFMIRGFQATTYRDGMTLGSMRGVREDPYAFERVEVLRGANSTLFGPADPGGSVNFVSKRPKFESIRNTYVTYGSNDHKEVGIDVGDTLNENETLAYRLTGKVKDSDREYDYSKDDSEFIMGGLTWEPNSSTSATLLIDYLNTDSTPNSGGYPMDREYSRSDFFGEPDYNFHNVERTNISAQITHRINRQFKVLGNLRYSDLTDDYGYIYISDANGHTGNDVARGYLSNDTEAQEFIGNTMLQYDASFDDIDSSTTVGIEYRNASTNLNSSYGNAASIDVSNPVYTGALSGPTPYGNKKQDYTTKSIFLQQNLSFHDKVIVTVGVRNDNLDLSSENVSNEKFDADYSETSLRGAITYKINDEVSAYLSQVESVAPPSIESTGTANKPERGEQYEVGVKYAPYNMNAIFSASVYDLTKDNVTITTTDLVKKTIGESKTKGLDLEAKADITENLSITAAYSYMKSEVVNDSDPSLKGNEFVTAPRNTASLWSHYTLPNQTMSIGLGARYVGSYYFDTVNTSKSEAATLFDASFDYQITADTKLGLNIKNLLDKQYVVGSATANYYNPGRDITLTLNHSW